MTTKAEFKGSGEIHLLQEQLAWYERALATRKDALWNWDIPSDSLIFSAAEHTDLGYPYPLQPNSMHQWSELIHPTDSRHVREAMRALLKGERSRVKLTYRLKTADQRWIWVLVNAQVTERDDDGRARRCMGHVQEIDDQVRTEQELFKTKKHFSLALRSAKCGFWNWDFQTDTIDVRIYHDRHQAEELQVQHSTFEEVKDSVHPDDLVQFTALVERYRQGEAGMIEGVWRVSSRTSGYRWILNRGEIIERDADNRPLLAVGTHTDITTQKAVETELRRKTELVNLAYKNTCESLWDWNPKSGEMYLSAHWLQSLGYAQSSPLQQYKLLQRIHTDDVASAQQHMQALLDGDDDTLHCEFRILLDQIGYIWVLVRGSVVERDRAGSVTRVVGTFTDISSLKEKSLLLEKNENQLELAMRGSNSALFDFNLISNDYEIRTFHEENSGIVEHIDRTSLTKHLKCIHPEDRDSFQSYMTGFSDALHEIHEARWRSRYSGLDYRWCLSKGRVAESDAAGKPLRIVGTIQDIHDQVEAEQLANQRHERLRYAFEGTGDALWDMNIANGQLYISQSWIENMGYNPSIWRYDHRSWGKLIHPQDISATKAALQAHYRGETPVYTAEYRVRTKSGDWHWSLARGKVIEWDTDNQPKRIVGTILDINQRKQIEQKLASAKELAETTLHAIADAVITTDRNGAIQSVNSTAEILLGTSHQAVMNQPLDQVIQLIEEDTQETIDNPALFCMAADLTVELEGNSLLQNINGGIFAVQCKASPIHGEAGKPIGSVLILQDVTASRDLSREIEHRSKHDPLTHLINRYEFENRLQKLLRNNDAQATHALCYLDLDQFKLVNDTCGHMAGDELLRQLSAELTRVVRRTDSLGRLGGDEFALLMENCNLEQALRVAESIHHAVTGFSFSWDDKSFKLGVSIGLVALDAHASPQMALQHADAACFVAKEQGRNRIHIHQEDDDKIALRQGEMGWIPRLHRALDEDRFVLYAQAIVDLHAPGNPVSHFELLLRMQEGDQTIPPGAFLPAAERYNLSSKLDQWVIRQTLKMIRAHLGSIQQTVRFNINLSAHSLNEPGFLNFIKDCIEQHKVPASYLCFEITETAAIANLTVASQFIDTLKAMGCEFALDDFGSGLSSFAYLKNFPVNYLKIDGTFIKELVDDPIDAAMVKSINEIGQIMNKQTVAEWVETQAVADILKNMGVNYAQGYFFSQPEPFDQALARLAADPAH